MEPKFAPQLAQELSANPRVVSPPSQGADINSAVLKRARESSPDFCATQVAVLSMTEPVSGGCQDQAIMVNPLMGRPNRPMTKGSYGRQLQAIFDRFPWLGRQEFEPAPGHLELVWAFLLDVERLALHVVPSESNPDGLIFLPMRVSLSGIFFGDSNHLKSFGGDFVELLYSLRHQMTKLCLVCGAPCKRGQMSRCSGHDNKPMAIFAEHFRGDGKKELRDAAHKVGGGVDVLPRIKLLDLAAARVFHEQLADKFKGGERVNVLERINKAGGESRRLQVLPPHWEAMLDALESSFPNFAAFVEILREQFALAAWGNSVLRLPNTLFVGEPGIGKTEVMKWLSTQLSVPCVSVDMASAQSNSQLSGSEEFWSNTKPGKVFNQLIDGSVANPLFLLDELDKACASQRFSPLSALYSLLERSSAEHFTDLSIQKFSVDASHINWIATANSVRDMPKPLLSRFCVLEIPSPDLAQSVSIAKSIYGGLLCRHSWGEKFSPELPESVIARLSLMPPRSMKATLERALGRAARSGRCGLIESDIPVVAVTRKQPFGFMGAAQEQES